MSGFAAAPSESYLKLIRDFPLRPIHSDDELAAATTVFRGLVDREDLTADEEGYLDVLVGLMKDYESAKYPLERVPASRMLRHLLEANNRSQSDLARETGLAYSTISEILSGKRQMSVKHIEVLSRHFHVSPATFIDHD